MRFTNGKAIIKIGRKIVAKVYDRSVLFSGTKLEDKYSIRYSLELTTIGMARECSTQESRLHNR